VTRVARRRTPGTTSSAFSPGTAAKRERSLAVASAHARRTDPRARPTRLSRRRDGPARADPSLDVGGFHHEVPGYQSFGTSSAAPRIRASMLRYASCSVACRDVISPPGTPVNSRSIQLAMRCRFNCIFCSSWALAKRGSPPQPRLAGDLHVCGLRRSGTHGSECRYSPSKARP